MEGSKKGNHHDQIEEEEVLLHRSKRRNKGDGAEGEISMEGVEANMEIAEKSNISSYKDAANGFKVKVHIGKDDDVDDGAISDDDVIEESTVPSSFGFGMTREEK